MVPTPCTAHASYEERKRRWSGWGRGAGMGGKGGAFSTGRRSLRNVTVSSWHAAQLPPIYVVLYLFQAHRYLVVYLALHMYVSRTSTFISIWLERTPPPSPDHAPGTEISHPRFFHNHVRSPLISSNSLRKIARYISTVDSDKRKNKCRRISVLALGFRTCFWFWGDFLFWWGFFQEKGSAMSRCVPLPLPERGAWGTFSTFFVCVYSIPLPVHSQEALEVLGIREHFKGVFGATSMGNFCKPDREAFRVVLERIGADASKTGQLTKLKKSINENKQRKMKLNFILLHFFKTTKDMV